MILDLRLSLTIFEITSLGYTEKPWLGLRYNALFLGDLQYTYSYGNLSCLIRGEGERVTM